MELIDAGEEGLEAGERGDDRALVCEEGGKHVGELGFFGFEGGERGEDLRECRQCRGGGALLGCRRCCRSRWW
jgi:hypothetical protein